MNRIDSSVSFPISIWSHFSFAPNDTIRLFHSVSMSYVICLTRGTHGWLTIVNAWRRTGCTRYVIGYMTDELWNIQSTASPFHVESVMRAPSCGKGKNKVTMSTGRIERYEKWVWVWHTIVGRFGCVIPIFPMYKLTLIRYSALIASLKTTYKYFPATI